MSYTNMFGRQFIKTSNGIIPMVLTGSSNCTMLSSKGREVQEKNWSAFRTDSRDCWVELPKEVLLKKVDALYSEDIAQCWKSHSKWVNSKEVKKFFSKACEEARTLEEILFYNENETFTCCVTHWPTDSFGSKNFLCRCCQTTEELEQWIREAKRFVAGLSGKGETFIEVKFSGLVPLHKIPDSCAKERPFVVKVIEGNKEGFYVQSKRKGKLTYSTRIDDAKRFLTMAEGNRFINEKLKSFSVNNGFAVVLEPQS